MIEILKALSAILIMVGITLIAWPKRIGMYFMFIAQVFLCLVYFIDGENWWGIMSVYAIFINIFGIYSWRKKRIG